MAERGIIFKDDFVSVPSKSWFDMSYDHLFSMNFGELVPSTCMECMAEDVIHTKSSNFTRLAPLVAPAFGKVNMFSYHFYVRNRDIWTKWDSFFTNADQKKSWQSSLNANFVPPVMPYFDIRKILYASNKLYHDYMLNSMTFWAPTVSNNDIHLNNNGAYAACVQYLCLWQDQDGNNYSAILKDRNHTFAYHDRNALIIPFIPNKDERNLQEDSILGTHHYNVFSNGSLFDYLGVDLSGVYLQQWQWLINANQYAVDHLSSNPMPSTFGLSAQFTPFISAGNVPYEDDLIGFQYTPEFFTTHAICGFLYYHSSGKYMAFSPYSHIFKVDGTDSTDDVSSAVPPLYYTDESSKINALPVRAYYFIYSEYFRDENYIDINSNVDFTRNGEDINWNLSADVIFQYLTLKTKAWEHDPYTTALPGPQRGPAVRFLADSRITQDRTSTVIPAGTTMYPLGIDDATDNVYPLAGQTLSGPITRHQVVADLSAATIENFRFANATQRYLEKVARSGNRYYEYMKAIFGADIEDAKLNRPIFLQGDKSPIQISEVLQTSASQLEDDQPLGQMAGRAVAVGNDDYLEFVTPDNGFFVELSCVIPRVSYQQGLNPMFTRKVQLDYPIPDYAQLGEEQVNTSELFYSANENADNQPFGFQSRYYQWKYNRDRISGEFKSSLDHWTFGRKFDTAPVAGKKFIEYSGDYRQFAVTDQRYEHVYTHMYHDIQVQRALPIFGVPSL